MDHRAQVLLRRTEDGEFIEVATIVSRGKGKEMVIRLPDGREEHHLRAINEYNVDQGSVTHRLRVAPEEIEQVLRDRPATLFKQLLAESGKPIKASALKARLHSIDSHLVDKAWESARRALDQDGEVRKSNERLPTYTLASGARDTNLQVARLGAAPPAAPREPVQPASGTAARPVTPPSEPVREATPAAGMTSDDGSRTSSEVPARNDRTAPDQQTDPLVERLRGLEILSAGEDLGALSRRPLSMSIELAKVKTPDLKQMVEQLEPPHRVLLALLLGHAKERLLAAQAEHITAAQHEGVLRAGLVEIANAGANAKRLYPALTEMTKRAVDASSVPTELLLDLARAFAGARSLGLEGLDVTLVALARSLAATSGSKVASWDLAKVASAARAADFARTGGRSALVAALHRVAPDEAADARWWEGATFDQLSEAGRGPLATALEEPVIARNVVQPIVQEAVRRTVSRAGLARLWLAPPVLATWVSGRDLKEAIIRTGDKDQVADGWAQELTDAGEIERMSHLLAEAQEDARSSRESEERLRQQVADLEERLRLTGEQLAAVRGHQSDLRGAHERQIKLELVKTIARMAAQVGQSPAARSDESLWRSVEHAASREGLTAIAGPGDKLAFDPAAHDPFGQVISAGSSVVVVRQGYTWSDGPEAVVILKAQVVPDGE